MHLDMKYLSAAFKRSWCISPLIKLCLIRPHFQYVWSWVILSHRPLCELAFQSEWVCLGVLKFRFHALLKVHPFNVFHVQIFPFVTQLRFLDFHTYLTFLKCSQYATLIAAQLEYAVSHLLQIFKAMIQDHRFLLNFNVVFTKQVLTLLNSSICLMNSWCNQWSHNH